MSLSPIFVVALAVVVTIEAAALFYMRPQAAVPAVVVGAVGTSMLPTLETSISGVAFNVVDFVTASLLTALLARLVIDKTRQRVPRPVLVLSALFAVAAVRGLSVFGIQRVGDSGRALIHFLVALGFFASSRPLARRPLVEMTRRTWIAAGAVVVGTQAFYWASHGFGTYSEAGDRGVIAIHALALGQALVFAMPTPECASRRRRAVLVGCGLLVLLATAQRTAILATLASLAVLSAPTVGARYSASRLTTRSIVLVSALALALAVLIGPWGLGSDLSAAVETASPSAGTTFNWRVEGWQSLVQAHFEKPLLDVAVGDPLGTGYARRLRGATVTESPHNMYVTALVSLGAFGLLALLAFYGWVFLARRHLAVPMSGVVPGAWTALLVGQLVYSIGYQLDASQGLLAGVAVALAAAATTRSACDTTRPPTSGSSRPLSVQCA